MSINAKLSRLAIDLHNVSQQSSPVSKSKPSTKTKALKQNSSPVAESWEDAASLSDSDTKSPESDPDTPVEAPGPDIKSPQTRAIDAEKELAGELSDSMLIPPPTPISPQMGGVRADWSSASTLGGGRPTYVPSNSAQPTQQYPHSNPSSSTRSTPVGSTTPTHRYPTPNPPLDSTSRDKEWDAERKRPEKTTATANRLIAGALGIKAPPKTEEQRRYERAVKEQEIKRRNREKEERKRAEEEDEKAKAAVWDS